MKRAESFYDTHAARYESKFDGPAARRVKRMEEDAILAFLFEHLPPPDGPGKTRLLELGCGTGLFTIPVAARGYEVTAVDVSSNMLAELTRKLAASDTGAARVTPLKADVDDLPDLGEFDGVYGIGLLEYLRTPEQLVKRAAGLLKPGGVLSFTGPTWSFNGYMYRVVSLFRKRMRMKLFTRRRMRHMFTAAGLEVAELREVGFHLPLMTPLTRIGAAIRRAPE